MIAPPPPAPVLPHAVRTVIAERTCYAPQRYVTHTPSFVVKPRVEGRSLTLNILLVSGVETSTKPDAFHAFVSVDGKPLIISLAPRGAVGLTFPGLRHGVHYIRYGTYTGTTLLQDTSFCSTIR